MTGAAEQAKSQKPGLPTWLKVVLILAIVAITGTIALFVVCSKLLSNIQDPQHIKQIASSFMTISDPPGGGFEVTSGIDIGIKAISFVNKPKDVTLCIAVFPETKDLDDPENALNRMNQVSVSTQPPSNDSAPKLPSSKQKFQATNKGSEAVGGRPMSYAVGYKIDTDGSKTPAFIGLFPPGPKGSVCIFGQSPGDKYDMDSTNEFLKSIGTI